MNADSLRTMHDWYFMCRDAVLRVQCAWAVIGFADFRRCRGWMISQPSFVVWRESMKLFFCIRGRNYKNSGRIQAFVRLHWMSANLLKKKLAILWFKAQMGRWIRQICFVIDVANLLTLVHLQTFTVGLLVAIVLKLVMLNLVACMVLPWIKRW